MTYVKTQLPTLKTHVVNLKRDAKDLSRDLQRLEVRGKLGSKTLYLFRLFVCKLKTTQKIVQCRAPPSIINCYFFSVDFCRFPCLVSSSMINMNNRSD